MHHDRVISMNYLVYVFFIAFLTPLTSFMMISHWGALANDTGIHPTNNSDNIDIE